MHAKVARNLRAARLEHVLEALARELIESTDEELLQAARDLGMDPAMRGSAAFIGLKFPATPRITDFFEMAGPAPPGMPPQAASVALARSRKQQQLPARRKARKPSGRRSQSDSG